jgi:hypothetical protein
MLSTMMTWDVFVKYLESHWQKPSSELAIILPNYIIYAITVCASTAWSSAEILHQNKVFATHPEALAWVQTCYSTTQTWKEKFREIKNDCEKMFDGLTACNCILQKLTPVISESVILLEQVPVVELQNEMESKIFNILKKRLSYLSEISTALKEQDMLWLKEFIDKEEINLRT